MMADSGNLANPTVALRDIIRIEARKMARAQDQVAIGTVTDIGDNTNVYILLDGFGAGPIRTTWVTPVAPEVGQRVTLVGLTGGESWYVVGVNGGSSGVTDHGDLGGLDDDDHPQYILADGTRAFSGTVEGIDPTLDDHLTTKSYVDLGDVAVVSYVDALQHDALGGLGDDDHTQYHTDARALTWHSGLSGAHVTNGDSHDHAGGDGAQIDHGALAGLADNDHTQYLLLAGGTMSGVLGLADGNVTNPGLSFGSDPNTGIYRVGPDVMGFTTGGVVALTIETGGFLRAVNGSLADPAYSFINDADTGMFRNGSGDIRMTANGTFSCSFQAGAVLPATTTTGSAANVFQTTSGNALQRFTSALRYKTHLSEAGHLADIELKPMKFYREDDDHWYYGFIADWLGDQDELLGNYANGLIMNYDYGGVLAVLAAKVNRLMDWMEESR